MKPSPAILVTIATLSLTGAAAGQAGISLKERGALEAGRNAPINSVAFSPDGKTLAVGCYGIPCRVQVWDVPSGREKATLEAKGPATAFYFVPSLAWSPDGKHLAAACTGPYVGFRYVTVWEAATGKERLTFKAHPARRREFRGLQPRRQDLGDGR